MNNGRKWRKEKTSKFVIEAFPKKKKKRNESTEEIHYRIFSNDKKGKLKWITESNIKFKSTIILSFN